MKPSNVLLKNFKTLEVKVADYGLAAYHDSLKPTDCEMTNMQYMAPEIIKEDSYDTKADIWSVGVIVYQLLEGNLPFVGSNHEEIGKSIKDKQPTLTIDDDGKINLV